MVSKLISVLGALTLMFVAAGCGGHTPTTSGATTAAPSATTSQPTTGATTTSTTSTPTSSTSTATATATSTVTTSPPTTHSTTSPTATHTPASTTTSCGSDCQPQGTPTVPGSKSPVNGKCPAGYAYLPPQDQGPALCIPNRITSTPTTSTH
jgi:hypothetical protein